MTIRALVLAAVQAIPALVLAQSPWLPGEKKAVVTTTFVWQGFDKIWVGSERVPLPSRVTQRAFLGTVEYGVTSSIAVDATSGFTGTDSTAFGGRNKDSGLIDTSAGIRWRFLDESRASSRFAPTITVRAAAIVKGTYRANNPFSAGDGAPGGEVSLLWGKALGETGAGVYGDAGFRKRSKGVPDDGFGSAGVYKRIKKVNLSAGYRHTNGLNGMNIGDPGFTFPKLKEVVRSTEFGAGLSKGKRYYQVFAAHAISGRNTVSKLVAGVSVSFHL